VGVRVEVGEGVGVRVGVKVNVTVGVLVRVEEGEGVGVRVGVEVGVGVEVRVGVSVAVGFGTMIPALLSAAINPVSATINAASWVRIPGNVVQKDLGWVASGFFPSGAGWASAGF
jgi:uncharacterized alkaline shock family protein YloU